jgi:tetratricopeptide (TPR) repeat protein
LEHTDHSPLNMIERDRMKLESSMRRMANTLSDFDSGLAGANHPGRKQALLLLEQAWQQSHQIKRIELARKALELYPDAADAYNILAETEARTLERIAEQYRRGIIAGQRDLGEAYFKENRGHFWGLIETRPYMRAKAGYAEACMYSGKFKEAIRHYEEILELNPNDNQGARDMLSAAYLERKQYREAAALLERFGEDSSSVRYDRVLIEYGLNGITDKLDSLFQAAKSSNSNVIPYLTGKKPAPDYVPDFIRPGDDSEAQDYVVTRIEAWTRESKLIRWVASKV